MRFLIAGCFILLLALEGQGAVTHGSHSHGSKDGNGQREKVQDGAFSPRDVHHHGADGKHDNAFDHEAIIGSAKEAAEFDNLAPEDAKARLRLLVGEQNIYQADVCFTFLICQSYFLAKCHQPLLVDERNETFI